MRILIIRRIILLVLLFFLLGNESNAAGPLANAKKAVDAFNQWQMSRFNVSSYRLFKGQLSGLINRGSTNGCFSQTSFSSGPCQDLINRLTLAFEKNRKNLLRSNADAAEKMESFKESLDEMLRWHRNYSKERTKQANKLFHAELLELNAQTEKMIHSCSVHKNLEVSNKKLEYLYYSVMYYSVMFLVGKCHDYNLCDAYSPTSRDQANLNTNVRLWIQYFQQDSDQQKLEKMLSVMVATLQGQIKLIQQTRQNVLDLSKSTRDKLVYPN